MVGGMSEFTLSLFGAAFGLGVMTLWLVLSNRKLARREREREMQQEEKNRLFWEAQGRP